MDENNNQLPPNGVLIYLDHEGDWIMSANRFRTTKVDEEVRKQMVVSAMEQTGLEEYEIIDRLPAIGDDVGQIENVQRVVASLEEATTLTSGLWAWLTGLEEEFPYPCACGEEHPND